MKRSAWRLLFVVGFGLAACTLLNPLDEYGPPSARALDGSPAGEGGGGDGGCLSERWPSRPATDGPDIGDIVFALETIAIGAGDAGPAGYDLDNVCTCPGPPSCQPAPTGKLPCDGDGGIDTAGIVALRELLQLSGSPLSLNLTARVVNGTHGILLRLRGYNGGPDDAQVELDLFLSGGTEGTQTDQPKVPARDGTDVWTVDPATLFMANVPPYLPLNADTRAYVVGGVLVATLDFPVRLSELSLSLRGSVFTGRLVHGPSDGALEYHLADGRLAGREPIDHLITSLDTARDPFSDGGEQGVCGDSGTYQVLKARLCEAVDIQADRNRDGMEARCDAVGMAFAFTAGPAKLGSVYAPTPRTRRCGDTWTDTCNP